VCDPAFGLDRCKSRQRFREGGFFYGFAVWRRRNDFAAEGQFDQFRQAGCGLGRRPLNFNKNPLILWASARYRDQPYNSG
jgi:hypothetical protein